MATKFVSPARLGEAIARLRALFVARELKTGSTTEYKVLSDNNLTDAMVKKIAEAGSSTFTGDYADLTGRPSIGGREIAAGDQTAASLGLITPAEVDAKITAAGASAYKAKGSTAFADLPALSDAQPGDVWNVIDAFATTADFAEGAGAQYPAGTNVVCAEVGGAKKWDALAGVTDLTGYWARADLVEATAADIDALFSEGA